jgi:hypothetical protein
VEAVAAGGGGGAAGGTTGEPIDERVRRFVSACGWEVEVARRVEDLDPPSDAEVLALRNYDPEGLFLN